MHLRDASTIGCDQCGSVIRRIGSTWDADPDFEPVGHSDQSREHLYEIQVTNGHFWFEGRSRLMETIADRLTRVPEGAAIELGCGFGEFLPVLAQRVSTVVGVDGHATALQRTESRGCATLVHGDISRVPLYDAQFDMAVLMDVLEHTDPIDTLSEAHRLVKPGGYLLVSVPAFQSLWSHSDVLAGHRCRYNLEMLRCQMQQTGWHLDGSTYYQCILFPALWITRRWAGGSRSRLERNPPPALDSILRVINRVELAVARRLRLPFGSTLIAWATHVAP